MRRFLVFLSVFSVFGVLLIQPVSPVRATDSVPVEETQLISTSRVVVYHAPRSGPSVNAIETATELEAHRSETSDAARTIVNFDEVLSGESLSDAIADMENLPGVIAVEPSIRLRASVIPNDPLFATDPATNGQWYLRKSDDVPGAINAEALWSETTGSNDTVVAILDTGYTDHEDLDPARIIGQADLISADDVGVFLSANDGDGRDTDAHDPGDWVTSADDEQFGGGCGTEDSSWHGTHVSGIVAATANNSKGGVGINWNTKLLQVRVLGKCGGYGTDIADGIKWAAGGSVSGLADNPNPADVINLSLGGYGECGLYTQNAIDYAVSSGAVVVVAAGNDNENASNATPANCNNVVVVGAVNNRGARAAFSNYGSIVDVAAPGVNILNTLNDGLTSPIPSPAPGGDEYRMESGTSMAAPIVSAVAAIIMGENPSLTPAQVEQQLQESGRGFPVATTTNFDCNNSTRRCGESLLDAWGAIGNITPVSAPSVVVSNTDLRISFRASPNADHYFVFRNGTRIRNALQSTSFVDRERATFTGTVNYRIVAKNFNNTESSPDENISFTVIRTASRPVITVQGGIESATINVNWNPSSPAITKWCVYQNGERQGCFAASVRTKVISAPAGEQSFWVRTVNANGASVPSKIKTIPISLD
jgi:serine protease